MSLRSKKQSTYNRMEEKEYTFFYLELFNTEVDSDWYDSYEPWDHDWYYYGFGMVHNMDEYHQMHLLTLLHRLNIGTAKRIVTDRGW